MKNRMFRCLLDLAAALAASAAGAQGVHECRLDNDPRVGVKEDHRAPAAVLMAWSRAGSMDEAGGEK